MGSILVLNLICGSNFLVEKLSLTLVVCRCEGFSVSVMKGACNLGQNTICFSGCFLTLEGWLQGFMDYYSNIFFLF